MTQTRTVDVPAYINAQRFSGYQWLVLILCFFIVAIDGFDTAAIGYIAPALVQEWGIDKGSLGPVLSAALFGLAGGAIFAGPLADRLGRKTMLVLSVVFFGVASLATAFAQDLTTLTVLRFLTGLGLGAAMPNAVTLISEFAPAARRAVIVNTMFCGFPLGASVGGFVASWLIPTFGWHSVLVLGGVLPLLLSVLLIFLLPESVKYLVVHQKPVERVRRILSRISGESLDDVTAFTVIEAAPKHAASPIGVVLSKQYGFGSVMLWVTYFMGLVIFYLLTSWMPILFKDAGFTVQRAALITALFPLGGGVGTILSGWLMDKFNAQKVVAFGYALTAVLVYAVGQAMGDIGMLVTLIFLAGTAMNGAQSSMPSLAAMFYPTHGRATGVAWMLGIGRFGGIAGALLGAELMRRHLGFSATFSLLAIPAVIATIALLAKNAWERARGDQASPQDAADARKSAAMH
ncbi:4-hydroxybenzoate transporter [Pandoraea pneumonica]|jgi:AAHS family 4-hydroxybenzoate transporter-like MFS transporter|uniref:4-hydroxybenzoate transporter n=1 Tax=Pandoraea pneumonica TaxID=2508299 RepID=A0A5E4YL48_9BURK|nr:MFS transporter [Pandoraea pneumonica]VVE49471.1 4-hydroxybenzoate transporter [Pandoraea pneumonica]